MRTVFSFLFLLFLTNSCRDHALIIHDFELKQDIHESGILDISSKIKFSVTPSEINIRFTRDRYWLGLGAAEVFGIRFYNNSGEYVEAGYNAFHEVFYVSAFTYFHMERYSIAELETLDVRIMIDKASIELSSMDGKVVINDRFFHSQRFNKIELFAENGKVYVENFSIRKFNR